MKIIVQALDLVEFTSADGSADFEKEMMGLGFTRVQRCAWQAESGFDSIHEARRSIMRAAAVTKVEIHRLAFREA